MRTTYNAQQHKLRNTEHEEEINGGSGRRAYYHQQLDELIGDEGSNSSYASIAIMPKRGWNAQVVRLDHAELALEVNKKKLETQANDLAKLQKQVEYLNKDKEMM